jgi:hypothetical protein
LVPKSVFDDAIFERMETNDHCAAAGLYPLGQRSGQKLLEVFEFVIDGNPQGLKDPRGRVNFVTSFRPARHRLGDGGDELGGRPVGNVRPTGDDGPSDRAAGAFFAELLKQIGQLGFAQCRKQL